MKKAGELMRVDMLPLDKKVLEAPTVKIGGELPENISASFRI